MVSHWRRQDRGVPGAGCLRVRRPAVAGRGTDGGRQARRQGRGDRAYQEATEKVIIGDLGPFYKRFELIEKIKSEAPELIALKRNSIMLNQKISKNVN